MSNDPLLTIIKLLQVQAPVNNGDAERQIAEVGTEEKNFANGRLGFLLFFFIEVDCIL